MTLYEFHGNWTIEAKDEEEAWKIFSQGEEADNYWIDTIYDKESDEWVKRSQYYLPKICRSKINE